MSWLFKFKFGIKNRWCIVYTNPMHTKSKACRTFNWQMFKILFSISSSRSDSNFDWLLLLELHVFVDYLSFLGLYIGNTHCYICINNSYEYWNSNGFLFRNGLTFQSNPKFFPILFSKYLIYCISWYSTPYSENWFSLLLLKKT